MGVVAPDPDPKDCASRCQGKELWVLGTHKLVFQRSGPYGCGPVGVSKAVTMLKGD